jgi:hypothetical protein
MTMQPSCIVQRSPLSCLVWGLGGGSEVEVDHCFVRAAIASIITSGTQCGVVVGGGVGVELNLGQGWGWSLARVGGGVELSVCRNPVAGPGVGLEFS